MLLGNQLLLLLTPGPVRNAQPWWRLDFSDIPWLCMVLHFGPKLTQHGLKKFRSWQAVIVNLSKRFLSLLTKVVTV